MDELFTKIASRISSFTGSPWAFIISLSIVIIWAASGPFFDYSTEWQLVINSGTTIATFLMVFLIQNTQNRDTLSIQIKLDAIIKSLGHADDNLMSIENKTTKQLEQVKKNIVKN